MLRRGVSFRELSRRTGIAPQSLQRYAAGRRLPKDETIALVARALEQPGPQVFYEWRRRRVVEQLNKSAGVVDALYKRLAG